MGALADVKREWKHFRDDAPGERFCNHRERMKEKSRAHSVVALIAGIVLVAAGIALLFLPGPGSVLIVFGVGLFASHSERLASWLDRTEPKLRSRYHRMKRKLH